MPVTLDIEENGKLFVLAMVDPWTMDQLQATFPKALAHLNTINTGRVHTLVDLTGLRSVPNQALKGRNNPFITHERSGDVAVVGANQYARVIVETALKIAGYKRVRFETHIETAKNFLRNLITQDERVLSSTKGD